MTNFFKGKRVLVAGGAGTIGIPLSHMLATEGADVTVVALDSRAYAKHVLPGIKYVRFDLTYLPQCILATKDMDMVFDMVGIKGSTVSNEANYSKMLTTYLRFQTNLMEAAKENHVGRYLYVGSVCAYPQMNIPKEEDDMWKVLPRQNDKFIGMVKRMGELQAQAYYEEGSWGAVRIIRPSNVYGPYDDFNPQTAQVIPSLIGRAVDGGFARLADDGQSVRDFVFSHDVAHWSMVAIEKLPPCEAVNISAGHGVTIEQVCKIISDNVPGTNFEFTETTNMSDPVRILSTEKASKLLGYQQLTPLHAGIKITIDWYKNRSRHPEHVKGKFYDK